MRPWQERLYFSIPILSTSFTTGTNTCSEIATKHGSNRGENSSYLQGTGVWLLTFLGPCSLLLQMSRSVANLAGLPGIAAIIFHYPMDSQQEFSPPRLRRSLTCSIPLYDFEHHWM